MRLIQKEIVPMSVNSSIQVPLPTDKELVLKVIPMPGDCNANGDIFGGWVMAQVDLAGSVIPARYTQGRMATVAVNEFIFKQPVRVGDILSFFGHITRVGNTSITVQVEVFAERFKAHYRGAIKGEVIRYPVEAIHAINFVCHGALGGGVSRSLCLDNYGKALSAAILGFEVEVPGGMVGELKNFPRD